MADFIQALFIYLSLGSANATLPPVVVAPTMEKPVIEKPSMDVAMVVPTMDTPDLFPPDCRIQPPQPYRQMYVKAALKHPSLSSACDLAIQDWQESRFVLDAVSPAGALGIAQFLPKTAEELGIDPLDPKQSIYAQARYVSWCQSGWTSDLDGRTSVDIRGLGLCCYNFGRGACFSNQAKHGWVLLCDALPKWPKETRNYVNIIERPLCTR